MGSGALVWMHNDRQVDCRVTPDIPMSDYSFEVCSGTNNSIDAQSLRSSEGSNHWLDEFSVDSDGNWHDISPREVEDPRECPFFRFTDE